MSLFAFALTLIKDVEEETPDVDVAPILESVHHSPSNKFVDLNFDYGVYSSGGPVTTSNFAIASLVAGGVTAISIASVKRNDYYTSASATALIGGERSIRIFLTLTGTPNSTETYSISIIGVSGVTGRIVDDSVGTLSLNNTPLMYWDMNESSSIIRSGLGVSELKDIMGAANMAQSVSGDRGIDIKDAVFFERANSEFLTAGDIGSVDFQKANSFTVIIKDVAASNAASTAGYIISNRRPVGNEGGWSISTGGDGSLFFVLHDGTLQGFCDVDSFAGSGTRTIVCVNNAGTMNVYNENNNVLGTTGNATGIGTITYTSANLIMGRRLSSAVNDLNGSIGSISIISGALSSTQRTKYLANLDFERTVNPFDFESRIQLAAAANQSDIAGEYVWGSTVIKEDDTYHAFIERWIDDDGTAGFAYYGKIYHASSANRLGPFETQTELSELLVQPWSDGAVFNPKIFFHDGMYYLYYVGTNFSSIVYPIAGQPARNNQRIGVAYSTSPDGPWTPYTENPILEPTGGWDQTLVNNPHVYELPDGTFRMMYKADYNGSFNDTRIGVASADHPLGPWTNADAPISLVHVEDPCVWKEGNIWHALIKDLGGAIVTAGAGIHMYSVNGDTWQQATNKVLGYRKAIDYDSKVTTEFTNVERPFVLVEDGEPTAFFAVVYNGSVSFNLGRNII